MRKVLIGLGILSSAVLTAQAVRGPEMGIGPETRNAFMDESVRLERPFGKVVTYEGPLLSWSGDWDPVGRTFQSKKIPFVKPDDSGDDPEPILARMLDAYRRQTDGPRFKSSLRGGASTSFRPRSTMRTAGSSKPKTHSMPKSLFRRKSVP
jgi:hypothetical protein